MAKMDVVVAKTKKEWEINSRVTTVANMHATHSPRTVQYAFLYRLPYPVEKESKEDKVA